MSYIFFFLLGIPLWLIPVAYMLRHQTAFPPAKVAWAALTFFAPFFIFSIGAAGNLLIEQRFDEVSAAVRGFGYFVVLLNILAFFSPFILQGMFKIRYGKPRP